MDGKLSGLSALVTGGGSGIGRATARLLAGDGADVTIAGRTAATLEAAADEIAGLVGASGGSIRWTTCDASHADQVKNAVRVASEPRGVLDIAVSVPGGGAMAPVLLYDPDEFERTVAFNVMAPFLLLKYAGAAMVRSGGGSFVAVSSTAAVQSSRYLAAYCAGKAGLEALVRVAADELGALGVRVNAVRPGLTDTGATEGLVQNASVTAQYLRQQPIQRVGEPVDIAHAIRYFAGPESAWTTGQCLAIDGGHTLRAFVDFERVVRARLGDDVIDRLKRGELDP